MPNEMQTEAAAKAVGEYLDWEDKNLESIPVDGVEKDAVQQEEEEAEEGAEEADKVEVEPEKAEEAVQELPSTIEDLASAIGIEASDILEMQIEANIDGERMSLPLKELLNGYQREASYTRKTQRLADERRSFEQKADAGYKAIQSDLIIASEAAKRAEEELQAAITGEDMKALLNLDPQEWARQQIALERKANEVKGFRQNVMENMRALDRARMAEWEGQKKVKFEREKEVLLEKLPEWRDQEKAHSEWLKIRTALESSYGFTRDELSSIEDHRLFLLARDAALYREAKREAKAVRTKKLAQLPKVNIEAGKKSETKNSSGDTKRKSQLRKVVTSGNASMRQKERAAASLIEDLI